MTSARPEPEARDPDLRRIPLFAGLTEPALALVAARTAATSVPAGTVLALEGSPCDPLHVVESGRVAASRTSAAGRHARIRVDDPPVAIDKATALAGTEHLYTWTTLSHCRIRRLPRRLFLHLVETEPSVALQTARHLATQSNRARGDFLDAVVHDPLHRTLRRLTELADADGVAALVDGQQGLADELGLSRVTVNRALQQLVRRGDIRLTRGRVELTRQERLPVAVLGGPSSTPAGAGRR
ncbi:Crp/Fnr family transcriptional regulator [Microlunatus parietis]|uniref:CRP/FNR family transcriptional regulator n=1 Tax=Microlunatus parietis TaxID=682979 RepID=A0A7Y9I5Q4_9ACTN|nr:Crp/Fnr family transcriptional regulator [Microlunatus parietis]NYE70583.1 CRP/FNR family transcriptional regulator [Microlunatus parietis]